MPNPGIVHLLRFIQMLFFFPAVKFNDGKVRCDFLDIRHDQESGVHSVDIINVQTENEDGSVHETHLGIQGKSDHLAKAIGKEAAPQLSKARETVVVKTDSATAAA